MMTHTARILEIISDIVDQLDGPQSSGDIRRIRQKIERVMRDVTLSNMTEER